MIPKLGLFLTFFILMAIHLVMAKSKKDRDEEEYDYDYDRDSGYGGGGGGLGGGINPLAALIAPLAALALLGAATAVAINPILVQLAVVSGRRKRDVHDDASERQLRELEILDRFIARQPDSAKSTSDQLVASYLQCSGLADRGQNECLEYLACLYTSPNDSGERHRLSREDKNVVSIILYNLLTNIYVDEETKSRVRRSARTSRSLPRDCSVYTCPLDGPTLS